ncbi:MAG TPA: acyl-CoA dehydratase activase-related protein, partial [Spirochaetia bacterium]|nr:acyl-CoA dehydratase activase-related protein [Spirochaetia bacterium]
DLSDSVSLGRTVQGAEFCAPVASLHGHVAYLADKADWIFLPTFLEDRSEGDGGRVRQQCYYTQFASALAARAVPGLRDRCLMPLLSPGGASRAVTRELHAALQRAGFTSISRREVGAAFARARGEHAGAVGRLRQRFQEETAASPGPHVVLLGRAYNVLPAEMGKDIARICAGLGVKAFFQDMVPCAPRAVRRLRPLLDTVHWLNAARTLETACVVADSPGLYGVYITSFKCSPDSIALEYFRRIMDQRGKPYLVLQLDDHDSTLGYETRVEAAVQSFRNHARREPAGAARAFPGALPLLPRPVRRIGGKTLLLPNWDPLVNPLLAANLRREGIDARLLEETPTLIRKGMRLNTGQCLPLSIIAQEAVDFIRAGGLDPAKTALWMPSVTWSCNLGMFTPFLQALLEAEGGGMEKVAVYAGDFFYRELSVRAVINAYRAYLLGGLLRTAACRLRPYESEPGSTDRAVGRAMEGLLPAFEGRTPRRPAVRAAAAAFHEIRVEGDRRPQVAVFGDLYVRDNDVMNQGLVAAIEAAGAEAVVTPYVDYVRIVVESVIRKMALEGRPLEGLGTRFLWNLVDTVGAPARHAFSPWVGHLAPPGWPKQESLVRALGLHPRHGGESFDNLLKVQHLARSHPDIGLFVQASPAFCCPSIVTAAMATDIERMAGVPVVSITYDGTGRGVNDVIVPYIERARSRDRLRPAS